MALKKKIDKAAFDKLSADVKAEYIEKDGEYVLDVEGDDGGDDVGALRRAKDREVQARKEAEKKAREAEAKLAEIDSNDARKRGDIETLEKSWKEKHDQTVAEYDGKLKSKDAFISRALVDNVANAIANEISTAPKLILPHIKARLIADLDGDEPTTKVLGTDGKLSAATVDDLKKELLDNKDYSSILRANKASGGAPGQKNGSAPSPKDNAPSKLLSQMNAKELAAHIEARKAVDVGG